MLFPLHCVLEKRKCHEKFSVEFTLFEDIFSNFVTLLCHVSVITLIYICKYILSVSLVKRRTALERYKTNLYCKEESRKGMNVACEDAVLRARVNKLRLGHFRESYSQTKT